MTVAGKLRGRELYWSRFFLAKREETIVDEFTRPIVYLWDWIDRTGGFPGKVFCLSALAMLLVGVLTWFSNKR